LLALSLALVGGCSNPGVDIGAKADVTLHQPVPLKVDQPIEVRIQGLAIEYDGTFITPTVFNMVEDGSSAEYARAIYGNPDYETKLSDGSIVWRYHYRPKSQQGSVLSVLGGGDKNTKDAPNPEHVTTLVFIRDDKVSGKWRG
jgi:hypothetical protein